MALAPKPITLTSVSSDDYEGLDPQPFVVVGDFPLDPEQVVLALESLPGYDAGAIQVLTNDEGSLSWVTSGE